MPPKTRARLWYGFMVIVAAFLFASFLPIEAGGVRLAVGLGCSAGFVALMWSLGAWVRGGEPRMRRAVVRWVFLAIAVLAGAGAGIALAMVEDPRNDWPWGLALLAGLFAGLVLSEYLNWRRETRARAGGPSAPAER